jgi:hypothetical protein
MSFYKKVFFHKLKKKWYKRNFVTIWYLQSKISHSQVKKLFQKIKVQQIVSVVNTKEKK